MKNLIQLIFLFLLSVSLIISCTKDADITLEVIDNIPDPAEKIFATVNGLVLDKEEKVLENALVAIGSKEVLTDENGFFQIADFLLKDGATIKVKLAGYYDAFGTIIPHADAITKINILLESIPVSQDYETGRVINFETTNGTANFPKDAFLHADGSPYNGLVAINGHSADPTSEAFSKTHPGILQTKDNNTTKLLHPFTFMRVELNSETGQQLLINQEVELKMDVPESLQSVVPTEAPLWYFDPEKGLWIEDGTAYLENNQYVGKVSHFTDWVCGLAFDYYTMKGSITQDGNPFPFADIGIKYGSARFSFRSNENGDYAIPIITYDRQLNNSDFFAQYAIDVQSSCEKVIYEATNLTRPEMDFSKNIAITSNNAFRVSGSLFCNTPDQAATTAYLLVRFTESTFEEIITPDANGQFNFVVTDCGLTNIILRGYNPDTKEKSIPLFVSENNESVDINVCDKPFSGGMTIELAGEVPYFIPNAEVIINTDTPGITHYQFLVTDFFPNFEGYEDYRLDYTIDAYAYDLTPDGNAQSPPFSFVWPEANIWDVPVMYLFSTLLTEVIEENDEKIILEVRSNSNVGQFITRQTNYRVDAETWDSNTVEFEGKIRLEAYK